jgi:hypothetical protein
MREEPGADKILQRADFKAIYDEAMAGHKPRRAEGVRKRGAASAFGETRDPFHGASARRETCLLTLPAASIYLFSASALRHRSCRAFAGQKRRVQVEPAPCCNKDSPVI